VVTIDPSVAAAVIASSAALLSYSLTQRRAGKAKQAAEYAAALRAVREFQELPFLIWRRLTNEPDVLREFARIQSERLSNVRYYVELLALEEPAVAQVYHLLQARVRRQVRTHRLKAWREAPLNDLAVMKEPDFSYDVEPERALCIETMRACSSWGKVFQLRKLRLRRLELEARANGGLSSADWFTPLHLPE
jgi:hypothetical protein